MRSPRRAAARRDIPAGHPKALSWDVLPWEEDDRAWYVVEHQGELEAGQVAELLGVSEAQVEQDQRRALRKLRDGLRAEGMLELTAEQLRRVFAGYDAERHRARREREGAEFERQMREFMGAAE